MGRAADADLTAHLDRLLSTYADKGTSYVARVVDVASGQELVLHDSDKAVAPASNAKLANVAAGLDRFGPSYVWRTYIAIDGNDLWLIGTGDPSCGDKRIEAKHHQPRLAILDEFADALVRRGVKQINGDLIFDDSAFDDQRVHPSWPKSELTDWWATPITALSLNQNCITVTAYPDHLDVLPKTQSVQLINHLRTSGPEKEPEITRNPDKNIFTVDGRFTKEQELDYKAIVDPGDFFADALRTRLAERGISIAGRLRRASREQADAKWHALKSDDRRDDRIVATHETAMVDVLERIDKQSQNLFADALCKLQGHAWDLQYGKDLPGSWASGGLAVHDFLQRQHIDDSQYKLVDGSGLSADNRVTARLVSDLLLAMLKHPHADVFRSSLSISGKDGTLDDRMMDLPGAVQGKSGTIDGVKALSGYLTTRDKRLLVFSMIFAGIPDGFGHRCQDKLDDACRAMFDWHSPNEAARTK